MYQDDVWLIIVRSGILRLLSNLTYSESWIAFYSIIGEVAIVASTDKYHIIATVQYQFFQWAAVAITSARVCTPRNRRSEGQDLQINACAE
jgi:hypothetical protein